VLHFSVKDTGYGIKDEDQKKLFRLFGKVHIKDGVNENGIGLGLNICK
jgi:signal transduction histidine kinase